MGFAAGGFHVEKLSNLQAVICNGLQQCTKVLGCKTDAVAAAARGNGLGRLHYFNCYAVTSHNPFHSVCCRNRWNCCNHVNPLSRENAWLCSFLPLWHLLFPFYSTECQVVPVGVQIMRRFWKTSKPPIKKLIAGIQKYKEEKSRFPTKYFKTLAKLYSFCEIFLKIFTFSCKIVTKILLYMYMNIFGGV